MPYAIAAIAPAPPTANTRSAPESSAAASVAASGRPLDAGGAQMMTSADTGDARRDHAHQHTARIRGAPTRRVDADARQWIRPPTHNHPGLGRYLDALRHRRE